MNILKGVTLLAGISCCYANSYFEYINVDLDEDLPGIGRGQVFISFSQQVLLQIDVSKMPTIDPILNQSIKQLKELDKYVSLKQCYTAEQNEIEKKIVCECNGKAGRIESVLILFSRETRARGLESCAASCSKCSGGPWRCLECAAGYIPAHNLPGLCTQICDASCQSCQHSSLFCTQCSPNYLPVTSLPGYCTLDCHPSCASCSPTSSIQCLTCSPAYFPTITLPGPCAVQCDPTCSSCIDSSIWCTSCSPSHFPETDLPGTCVRRCDSSCRKCHLSAVACDSCAPGYHPVEDLPGLCVRNRVLQL